MVFIGPPGMMWNLRWRFSAQDWYKFDHIWYFKVPLLFAINTKTISRMKQNACASIKESISVLGGTKGHRHPGIFCIFWTFHMFCIFWLNVAQPGWTWASQPFKLSPPYWSGFLLSRWAAIAAILGRDPSRCEENQLTFRAQLVIKLRMALQSWQGRMQVVVFEQMGPVMGDQAIIIAAVKNETLWNIIFTEYAI